MKSKWLIHREKEFIYADFSNFKSEDFEFLKTEVLAVEAEICGKPENSVLVLTDVRGSIATKEALDVVMKSATRSALHTLRQAVVGVTGAKKILFDAVVKVSGQNAKTFDDAETAKDWLVKED